MADPTADDLIPDFGLDYAAAPESTTVVSLADEYGLFIGGEFVEPRSGRTFDTINPATEERLATVAEGGAEDVDRAVAAAGTAFEEHWRDTPGTVRARYLYRIARQLQERSREFAVLETMDGGKPIRESRDVDLPLVAAHFFHHAGWADKLEHAFPNRDVAPHGVVGQIVPWNFPLLMAAWKLAPALACGNTVVLKPAETTPLTALLLAEVLRDVDLPPGVVNIVTGAGETGAALVGHPDVDKLAFTGSTGVGKQIQRSAAVRRLPLTLELGGKAANVVFEDAAIDQAIESVINGIYFNQGHVCCAGSRLLVQESIAEDFVERLEQRMARLRVGDPLDKNTDVGAINSAEQLARITALVESGVEEGAVLHQAPCDLPDRGFWFAPSVFTGVQQSHRIAREEIFGPVLAVQTFRTPEEAVEKANNSPYGLSAGIWTEKGSKILWMAEHLPVDKTFKLFIGGAFPRSESGHTFQVRSDDGRLLANAAKASRKDLREAVRAARSAQAGWAGRTAYNRGQVLYRVAEMLDARRDEFVAVLRDGGRFAESARNEVEQAVDRWVWYAGWADKVHQVLGTVNPVAGPFFNFTYPEPTGVVVQAVPDDPPLLGLASRLAPAIVTGNTSVVLAGEAATLVAMSLAEVLATSDVPGGVVNILTGDQIGLLPWALGHLDVNAVDLSGAPADLPDEALADAAENVKRLVHGDATAASPSVIAQFLEMKTVWHPIGR